MKAGAVACPTQYSRPQKCDLNSGLLSEQFTLFLLLLKLLRGSHESGDQVGVLGGAQVTLSLVRPAVEFGLCSAARRDMDTEKRKDMTGRPSGTKVIGKCPNAYHPGMIGIKISRLRLTQSVGLASRAKEISMSLVVWCPPPSCGMHVIKASGPGRSGYSRTSILPWKKCLGCSQTPAPSQRGGELRDSLPMARHVAQLEITTQVVTCHTDHGAWLCTQPLTLTGP